MHENANIAFQVLILYMYIDSAYMYTSVCLLEGVSDELVSVRAVHTNMLSLL